MGCRVGCMGWDKMDTEANSQEGKPGNLEGGWLAWDGG